MATYLSIENQINQNQTFQQPRYIGHILNFIVKAFLFTNNSKEQLIESYDREDKLEEKLDNKRQKKKANSTRVKMGIIGKIYNLVVYIHASPNYINKFEALSRKLIPLDNRTRQNSQFYILYIIPKTKILNTLWNYIKAHINKGTINKKDKLTPFNITLYYIIKQFLSIFKSVILFLKG